MPPSFRPNFQPLRGRFDEPVIGEPPLSEKKMTTVFLFMFCVSRVFRRRPMLWSR